MAARHRAAKTATDVYRGYIPIGLPQNRPPQKIKPWWKVIGKPRVTLYPKKDIEGYSEQPEYPSLSDGSMKGCKSQVRYDWYEHLKTLPTVEEKLYEITRHPQHRIAHINNWMKTYNSLPIIKYITQTHLIESLPDRYNISNTPDNDNLFLDLKQSILDQIALDKYESIKSKPKFVSKIISDGNMNAHVSNRMIQNIVSIVKKTIALDLNQELLNYQYDLSPALRSWWYHSGLKPYKDNSAFVRSRMDKEGNINQMIQLHGSSAINIRSENFIEPVISQTDSLVTDTNLVENYNYSLMHYGATYKFKRPVCLPGFWFEHVPKIDIPHTCFLSGDCLRLRNSIRHKLVKPLDDIENCFNGQAILSGFGWLNSLSQYHGFTPFHELEYPFTCQLITTDGQNWMFNVYQLNSHSFHRDFLPIKKNNICWSSGNLQLYKDYKDGKFIDVDDQVLKLLIKFVSQKTNQEYTSSLNLRPYLGVDERSDEEKEKMFLKLKKLFENRGMEYQNADWRVPMFEHIFFRAKVSRHQITHMKPQYHHPKPTIPPIFD